MSELEDLNTLIVEFYEKLSSWEHAVVRDCGLTLPQMHTLEIVGQLGTPRMKDLAHKMGVSTGTVTVTVDGLEKRGLVARVPHEADRRSILVTLTDKGREAFNQHHRLHIDLARELTAALTPEEAQSFRSILAKIGEVF